MKKKVLSVLLVAAMAMSMLTGCGSKPAGNDAQSAASSEASKETEAAAETTASAEDETLTVWCWDPNFNVYAMKQAEKAYQVDHPNFKLDIQEKVYSDIETALITAAEAGDYSTLPDIFLMQDYSFHKNATNYPGIFTALDDCGIDFSQFSMGKLADSTVDGTHYGIPFDNGATIMAIRSDMVEAAGLKVEDFKDTTWSEFMELSKKVMAANDVPMLTCSGGSEIVIEMLQSAGASLFNEDGTTNIAKNDTLKKVIDTYCKMKDSGVLQEVNNWDEYTGSMLNSEVAGVINGCWIMGTIQTAEDQSGKWAITNIPKLTNVKGATNYSNIGGSSWAISGNCGNVELAEDFLASTFAGSTELYNNILSCGAIATWTPAGDSDAYAVPNEFFSGDAVFEKIVDYSTKVPSIITGPYFHEARDAISVATTNITNGADLEKELKKAEDTVNFNMGQ